MTRFALVCLLAATLAVASVVPALGVDTALPYLIAEDGWIYMIEEPGLHLDRAHEELQHGRPALAAAEVRKAAALLGNAAGRAGGPDQDRLRGDSSALLQVADQIEAGQLTAPGRLELAVARARADLGVPPGPLDDLFGKLGLPHAG